MELGIFDISDSWVYFPTNIIGWRKIAYNAYDTFKMNRPFDLFSDIAGIDSDPGNFESSLGYDQLVEITN